MNHYHTVSHPPESFEDAYDTHTSSALASHLSRYDAGTLQAAAHPAYTTTTANLLQALADIIQLLSKRPPLHTRHNPPTPNDMVQASQRTAGLIAALDHILHTPLRPHGPSDLPTPTAPSSAILTRVVRTLQATRHDLHTLASTAKATYTYDKTLLDRIVGTLRGVYDKLDPTTPRRGQIAEPVALETAGGRDGEKRQSRRGRSRAGKRAATGSRSTSLARGLGSSSDEGASLAEFVADSDTNADPADASGAADVADAADVAAERNSPAPPPLTLYTILSRLQSIATWMQAFELTAAQAGTASILAQFGTDLQQMRLHVVHVLAYDARAVAPVAAQLESVSTRLTPLAKAETLTAIQLRQMAHELVAVRQRLVTLQSSGMLMDDDRLHRANAVANADLVARWKRETPDVLDVPLRTLWARFCDVWAEVAQAMGPDGPVWGCFTDPEHTDHAEEWWIKAFVALKEVGQVLYGDDGERLLYVGAGVLAMGVVLWLLTC